MRGMITDLFNRKCVCAYMFFLNRWGPFSLNSTMSVIIKINIKPALLMLARAPYR